MAQTLLAPSAASSVTTLRQLDPLLFPGDAPTSSSTGRHGGRENVWTRFPRQWGAGREAYHADFGMWRSKHVSMQERSSKRVCYGNSKTHSVSQTSDESTSVQSSDLEDWADNPKGVSPSLLRWLAKVQKGEHSTCGKSHSKWESHEKQEQPYLSRRHLTVLMPAAVMMWSLAPSPPHLKMSDFVAELPSASQRAVIQGPYAATGVRQLRVEWDWLLEGPLARAADEERIAFDEAKILEQNRRIQTLNNVPPEFPGFIRKKFEVKVVTDPDYVTTETGLLYKDISAGEGSCPIDGQEVVFNYTGYNESGRRVDSSYQQGQPARTRLGVNGMIPGFEEGIKSMKVGGTRRIIIPPELGPPTGPGTFFSAKQYEVFDVELIAIRNCERKTIGFFSNVECTDL